MVQDELFWFYRCDPRFSVEVEVAVEVAPPSPPLVKVTPVQALTPMMQQYQAIKRLNPGALVFFRLGDFYEMFYEDAVVGSRELEITLTSRHADRQGSPIPMCGVPHQALDNYLGRLVKKGYRVAICEQVEDPRRTKGLVRRQVTRTVTPGTATGEDLIGSGENNFLASLVESNGHVGASFLDLSTGEFCLTEFSGQEAWTEMQRELLHFHPSELIVPEEVGATLLDRLPEELQASAMRTSQADWTFRLEHCERLLLEHFKLATLEGFGVNGHTAAVSAAGALLHYVQQTQQSELSHINRLSFLESADWLKMDDSTIRNLELVRGIDGNKQWTLLAVLDLTKTGMGARLLRKWMLRPSLKLEEIEQRLDAVQELGSSILKLGTLGKLLAGIQDMERLLGRVTLERANARDLLALEESLQILPKLCGALEPYKASLLCPEIDLLEDIVDLLSRAIAPDPPVSITEGGIIRDGFHEELDQLREISRSGKSVLADLQGKEREATGIASLKVKYNRVFGYFIEVTKTHLASVPEHYQRKQTLVGAERFVTPELKEYEEKILGAEERILELEKECFVEVRRQVGLQARRIQEVASTIARLDVLRSLAEAAKKYHYVRPRLDAGQEILIRAGRHPVLELQSGEPFVPNDLHVNNTTDQLLLITGPNMGGKSTYLRQSALVVILAQMGSFVPAKEAHMGLVDQIFTRVGASDNLARGRSTFMVEMIETAYILNTATSRSLVLLDEVGRGTATFDGLSLAWSVAEYLHTHPNRKARTLFATHYHELTQLEKLYGGVKNYCVTVRESGDDILFFHRVSPGVANKSYGIEVARLAGLPAPVLERARAILSRLERKEIDLSGQSRRHSSQEVFEEIQQKLF